ncbi:hypothetical protein ACNSTU_11260 [Aquisalimonas sp. APHAB1-3]|uniref:hypothetical protein n=1 Tax=Aquisalimonas sp. APHAB1-3 TaxID=3402080 RepID=UPI003AAEB635
MNPGPQALSAFAQDELEATRQLQQRLTDALANLVDSDGVLADPETGRPSPDDHYACTFTALACTTANHPHRGTASRLINHFTGIPDEHRGHGPFNRLALLLTRDRQDTRQQACRRLLDAALEKAHAGDNHRSNNWAVLATLCRLLEARTDQERSQATRALVVTCERWMTPAGGFVDFPQTPDDRLCTPLTYHAKVLFCLHMACRIHADRDVARLASQAARWLEAFTDETGAAGGFGRSTHALFGYGALLSVYTDHLVRTNDRTDSDAWADRCRRLRTLLESQTRPDGLLNLNLNPTTGLQGGWDPYMVLTVYNAWTAGLLGATLTSVGTGTHTEPPIPQQRPTVATRAVFIDKAAGLLSLRSPTGQLGLSTRGQVRQTPATQDIDTRYGALLPFNLTWKGRRLIPAPARFRSTVADRHPAVAGWAPLFRYRGAFYTLAVTADWDTHTSDHCVLVIGRSVPSFNGPAARGRSPADRIATRVARSIRGPLPKELSGNQVTHALWVDLDTGQIASMLVLDGVRGTEVDLLNPFGHALIRDAEHLDTTLHRASSLQSGGVDLRHLDGTAIPSSVAGATGFAAPPMAWPTETTAMSVTTGFGECANETTPVLHYDAAHDALIAPIGTFPLPHRAR